MHGNVSKEMSVVLLLQLTWLTTLLLLGSVFVQYSIRYGKQLNKHVMGRCYKFL